MEEEELDDSFMQHEAQQFTVGQRCRLPDTLYFGYIAYIGLVPEIHKGHFIGIKLDQPHGMNDGL